MGFSFNFKYNLLVVTIIGFFGGLVFAILDIVITAFSLEGGTNFLSFPALLKFTTRPILIYTLGGALSMIIYGSIIFILAKAGDYRLNRKKIIALNENAWSVEYKN